MAHCDTEVIIHGYEEYGTALAARLRGMFAFVVWDTKTNEMYGARDIFGNDYMPVPFDSQKIYYRTPFGAVEEGTTIHLSCLLYTS